MDAVWGFFRGDYVAWLMERCALSRVKANVLDHNPVSATVLQRPAARCHS
ncbi:hypothetical protein ACQEPV_017190 [Xanthomonas oryzae pv. oryzicola]